MYNRIVIFLLAAALCFAQQQGTITGQIFDAANGQPVRNATVATKENPALSIKTDTDGKYSLSVPPGRYTLVVKADNFLDTQIENVEAKAGVPVEASTVVAAKGSVTSVDVVEKAGSVTATAEAMLSE